MTDSIVLRGGTVLTMDDSHTIHGTVTSWSSATGSRRSARASRSPRARGRSTRPAAS